MKTISQDLEITRQEIVDFFRNGFMTLERLTTPEDLAVVVRLLDGLFDRFHELPGALDLGNVKHHDGKQAIPQINGVMQVEPRLTETLTFRNALQAARWLLGEEASVVFDHAIYKPPHNEKETPWHQDMAYGRGPDHPSWNVAFWIPLQEATVQNGCMHFIPHSHLADLKPHHPAGHNPEMHTLETDEVDPGKAVPCPVPAGGATLHLPKTLHHTGPNRTDIHRKVWIINFGVSL